MEIKENEVTHDPVKVEKEHVMRVNAKDPIIVQMLYELKFIKHHLEFQNSLIQDHHNALIKKIDKFIIIFCAFMVMLFAVFALFFANGPQQTVKPTSTVVHRAIKNQKKVDDGIIGTGVIYQDLPDFEAVDGSGKTSLVEIDKEDKEHEYRPKLNLNQNSR